MSPEQPGFDTSNGVGTTTGSSPPDHSAATTADHPDLETWIAYHEGRLDEQRSAELQDHLVSCRECIDLLLDLDAFEAAEAKPPAPAPVSFEKEALWRTVAAGFAAEDRAAQPSPPAPWYRSFALAAALMVAVLGLSALGLHQRTELGDLRRQIAQERLAPNMAIHDLLPGAHRSRSSGVTFEVPAEASHFTLILNLERDARAEEYRVLFRGLERDPTLQVGGLKPVDSTLTLGLSRQLLPAGEYDVELYDASAPLDDGGADDLEPVETYRLVLVYR